MKIITYLILFNMTFIRTTSGFFEVEKIDFETESKDEIGYVQRTINKYTVTNILYNIFSTDDNDKNNELNIILKNNIHDFPYVFGGSCSPYQLNFDENSSYVFTDPSRTGSDGGPDTGDTWITFNDIGNQYSCSQPSHTNVHFHQQSNVLRAGLIQKTCGSIIFPELDSGDSLEDVVLEENEFIDSLLTKINSGGGDVFTEENIINTIHQFYPFLKQVSIVNSFINQNEKITGLVKSLVPESLVAGIIDDVSGVVSDDEKKFRVFVYTMCIDPGWQM